MVPRLAEPGIPRYLWFVKFHNIARSLRPPSIDFSTNTYIHTYIRICSRRNTRREKKKKLEKKDERERIGRNDEEILILVEEKLYLVSL